MVARGGRGKGAPLRGSVPVLCRLSYSVSDVGLKNALNGDLVQLASSVIKTTSMKIESC